MADATPSRPLSLAHLSLIGTAPDALVMIAAQAGFDFVDLRLAPATPTDRRYSASELAGLCQTLRPILADRGMKVWDVEIIRLGADTDPEDYLPLMETAAGLGAQRIKLVCDSHDHVRAAELLAELCALARPFGLTLDLEYMVFSGVTCLKEACAIAAQTNAPNLNILVDALHFMRAGDRMSDLQHPAAKLGYVQLCDGPLEGPQTREGLIHEARNHRLAPGHGEFPLSALLGAMPRGCLASLEVPLPVGHEPAAHARTLLNAARRVMERAQA